MFVRIRQSHRRLQLSLAETRRAGAKVTHDHVAGLGSISTPPTPADRIAFWTVLHQRLARLGNRIDAPTLGKILATVHAKVPMPTPDDQRAVKTENVKSDADLWTKLHGMHAADIASQREVIATATSRLVRHEAGAAQAAEKAKAAEDRMGRIERGEDTGGIGRQMTAKELRKALGMTQSEADHRIRLAMLPEDTMGVIVGEGAAPATSG